MRKSIFLAALLVSGCNFAPRYQQPVTSLPASYPADAEARQKVDQRLATDLGWREFFGDAHLQAHIAAALEHNRDLAQATARIAQARAQFRITDAQRLPALDVGAGGTRTRQPTSTLGLGDPSLPPAITYNQFNTRAAVTSFEIDFWGRVRNLSESARERYLASVEGERAFRITLIGQVAATYFSIISGEERIELAVQSVTSRQDALRIAQRRLDAGVTSTVDFDQARLLVTQAETELAELRRTVGQSRNLLDQLTGAPAALPAIAPRPISDPLQTARIEPGLPSSLIRNRPDVIQQEHLLRAANADIGAARAAFFPNISLTGNFGWASNDLDALFNGNSQAWAFGGAINLPIFDFGRRAANVKLTRAQAEERVAAFQKTVQTAFREVADGLLGRRYFAEQITAQRQAVDAQRRLARTARLRYDNGIAIYLEVLDAERNLFAAEQALLELRAAALQNDVSLYAALGGGLTSAGTAPVADGG